MTRRMNDAPPRGQTWPLWHDQLGYAVLARYVCEETIQRRAFHTDFDEAAYRAAPAAADRDRAERLFELLTERKIRYAREPRLQSKRGQLVRDLLWMLDDNCGTCIDFAALYAALCVANSVPPLLAVTHDHAFVVVTPGRDADPVPRAPFELDGFEPDRDEPDGVLVGTGAALAAAAAAEQVLAIDSVGAACVRGEPLADFHRATRLALTQPDDEQIRLIDVPWLRTRPAFDHYPEPTGIRPRISSHVPLDDQPFEEFESRRDVLADLCAASGTIVLYGDSGRGKSEIARRVARNAAFGAAWFLDASDREALIACLLQAELRERSLGSTGLQPPERAEDAHRALARLEAGDGRWVVVLDNADGDPGRLSDLLPRPKPGQLLIVTTTDRRWLRDGVEQVLLEPLTDADVERHLGGPELVRLVAGRPLLLDAFARLRHAAGLSDAEIAAHAPDADPSDPAVGPRVFWKALRSARGFDPATHGELAAAAAYMPPGQQPLPALTQPTSTTPEQVAFLAEHGLFSWAGDSDDPVRMHRLFGAAVREQLEESQRDRVARVLPVDDRAYAALDTLADPDTVLELDRVLRAVDGRTEEVDRELGVAMHGVAKLLELHANTRRSGELFALAERHLGADPERRADCLHGRARLVNQQHPRDRAKLLEALGQVREAQEINERQLGRPAAADRSLALEGLLRQKLARFPGPGESEVDLLRAAKGVIAEADRRRVDRGIADERELARSRFNLGGINIRLAQADPARAAEYLADADGVYAAVERWRVAIYGRNVHSHIAACILGRAIAHYYMALLVAETPAERSKALRDATDFAVVALKQRELLEGDVDRAETAKCTALLAKISIARNASPTKPVEAAAEAFGGTLKELLGAGVLV